LGFGERLCLTAVSDIDALAVGTGSRLEQVAKKMEKEKTKRSLLLAKCFWTGQELSIIKR